MRRARRQYTLKLVRREVKNMAQKRQGQAIEAEVISLTLKKGVINIKNNRTKNVCLLF